MNAGWFGLLAGWFGLVFEVDDIGEGFILMILSASGKSSWEEKFQMTSFLDDFNSQKRESFSKGKLNEIIGNEILFTLILALI